MFLYLQITKSKERSEEIVADIFINIWNNRKKRTILNLKSYLYRSVRNNSLKSVSSISRTYYLEEQKYFLSLIEDENRNSKIQDVLHRALEGIKKMSSQRKIIFELSRINGLKYNEIAEILGVFVYTVQNQMVKAVRFLDAYLKQKKTSHYFFY